MRATWDRIESRLRANAPQVLASLRPGATDEQIAETEKLLGVAFPKPVRESYRIHDGQAPHSRYGLIDGWEFLSLERIKEEWGCWMGLLDADDLAGRETETQAGVRPGWWNPGWIPLIYGGTGDTHCLDLDPAPGGDLGQIITMWHDSPERHILAPSFSAWLGQLANALEAGRNFLDDYALVIWDEPPAAADRVCSMSEEPARTSSMGIASLPPVGQAPEVGPHRQRRDPLRMSRTGAVVALVLGVLSFALTWGQHQWQVPHPHPLPLILLLLGMTLAASVAVIAGLWRIAVGPRRPVALMWACGSLLPLFFWGYVGLHAGARWKERRVPNDLTMKLAKILGVTFMRLEATFEYPNRLETGRLVMFYDRLDHPRRDAEAMERHLAQMEAMLGGPLRSKVHWVRGNLKRLDLRNLCVHGIALGSGASPDDWDVGGVLDRHELAHAALDQYRTTDADPAYFLHEGWAEARSGVGTDILARRALEQRAANPSLGVRDMVGPDWYHRDLGPVYPLGGAFVDFLIRKHGVGRFVRLYNGGRPGSFDAECRGIFGSDLAAMEEAFWEDAWREVEGSHLRRPLHGAGP